MGARLQEVFQDMDTDQDGILTYNELFDAIKKVDPRIRPEDVRSIMKSIDLNKDGHLSYSEVLTARVNRKLSSKEARLRKVFNDIDIDQNGTITENELRPILERVEGRTIPPQAVRNIMAEVDKNHNGEIDYEE